MLLKDSPQKKKNFAVFSKRTRKGELMQKTGSDQWIVAYSEPPVYVDCQNDQVKFINTLYVPYLLAVKNLEIRYNLFTNEQDSLTYSVLLNVGDKVDVMMDQQVIPTSGIVRYKGNLPGKSGIYFGIEIMVSFVNSWLPMYVLASLCLNCNFVHDVYMYSVIDRL